MLRKVENAGTVSFALESRKDFPQNCRISLRNERKAGYNMLDPQRELNLLGLSPRLIGYWDILAAVEIVAQDKSTLTAMTKEVYGPAAARRSVEWGCAEAAIRKAIRIVWQRGNRARLEQIMHHTLPEPPPAGEFLGAFVFHLEGVGAEYEALMP